MSTQETNNMSSFDFSFYIGPCTLHAHILISVEERLQPIKQIELSILFSEHIFTVIFATVQQL